MWPGLDDDRATFLAARPVSRETALRLDHYASLLRDRNQRLSLVADSTLPCLWTRHFLDCAQLTELIPDREKTVVDIGTGAGFPGLVLAILGLPHIHLVENNMQKVAFLRTVIAELGLAVTLHPMKVEAIRPFPAGVVTARALKPLAALIGLGRKFCAPETVCVFPKGRKAEEELAAARHAWSFAVERFPSVTDSGSTIFRLSRIEEARR